MGAWPARRELYASAIIVINYDTVGRWAGQRRVAYTTFAELSQKPEVYELVKQDIDRINSDFAPRFQGEEICQSAQGIRP